MEGKEEVAPHTKCCTKRSEYGMTNIPHIFLHSGKVVQHPTTKSKYALLLPAHTLINLSTYQEKHPFIHQQM